MPTALRRIALVAAFSLLPFPTIAKPAPAGSDNGPVLAAFAHPDDERVVGPLLAKLAREGREVHLVVATDGSKGVRDYAKIPAGPQLVAERVKEAQCAADRLGVKQLHMLGVEDGSMGMSLMTLAGLRTKLKAVIDAVKPAVVITFGPEGGTGHPDHRLIGNVTTEIVQTDGRYRTMQLFHAGLPNERLRAGPKSMAPVNGPDEELLTVRVPAEPQDFAAARESFACHRSQYTPAEMEAINATLTNAWNRSVYLRPVNAPVRGPLGPFRR